MERLTYQDKDGGIFCPWERNSVNGSYDIWDEEGLIQQINRLAAYEDTGLEPEEIIGLKNTCEQLSGINDSLFKANQEMGKDLAEWKKAHDDGRLVVLPCKVGDHVWADGREAIVVWFFGYKTERYLHAQFFDNAEHTDIPFYEIGKTVFPTREEAEAALKGGEG